MTVHKYYIPVEGNKVNNIKVELYYSLGGMNYFTGRAEERGYYLSVTPVFKEDRGGCFIESMTAFTGTKMLLLPVARKSAKAGKEAFGLMKEKADVLIDFVCRDQDIKILKEC
jgi:hypothetical protein